MSEIVLNGEKKSVASGTVEALLSELQLTDKKVAVERNQQIVPRNSYHDTKLEAGDCIEIVQFVGGG